MHQMHPVATALPLVLCGHCWAPWCNEVTPCCGGLVPDQSLGKLFGIIWYTHSQPLLRNTGASSSHVPKLKGKNNYWSGVIPPCRRYDLVFLYTSTGFPQTTAPGRVWGTKATHNLPGWATFVSVQLPSHMQTTYKEPPGAPGQNWATVLLLMEMNQP